MTAVAPDRSISLDQLQVEIAENLDILANPENSRKERAEAFDKILPHASQQEVLKLIVGKYKSIADNEVEQRIFVQTFESGKLSGESAKVYGEAMLARIRDYQPKSDSPGWSLFNRKK